MLRHDDAEEREREGKRKKGEIVPPPPTTRVLVIVLLLLLERHSRVRHPAQEERSSSGSVDDRHEEGTVELDFHGRWGEGPSHDLHARGRRGHGALLGDLHDGLVEGVGEMEVRIVAHAHEGPGALEHLGDPHGLEGLLDGGCPPLQPELGDGEVNLAGEEAREDGGEGRAGEAPDGLHLGLHRDVGGQNEEGGEVGRQLPAVAGIRPPLPVVEPDDLGTPQRTVGGMDGHDPLVLHVLDGGGRGGRPRGGQGGSGGAGAGAGPLAEGPQLGPGHVEAVRPGPAEVHRVDEGGPGEGIDGLAGVEEVPDLPVSRLLDPVVDGAVGCWEGAGRGAVHRLRLGLELGVDAVVQPDGRGGGEGDAWAWQGGRGAQGGGGRLHGAPQAARGGPGRGLDRGRDGRDSPVPNGAGRSQSREQLRLRGRVRRGPGGQQGEGLGDAQRRHQDVGVAAAAGSGAGSGSIIGAKVREEGRPQRGHIGAREGRRVGVGVGPGSGLESPRQIGPEDPVAGGRRRDRAAGGAGGKEGAQKAPGGGGGGPGSVADSRLGPLGEAGLEVAGGAAVDQAQRAKAGSHRQDVLDRPLHRALAGREERWLAGWMCGWVCGWMCGWGWRWRVEEKLLSLDGC